MSFQTYAQGPQRIAVVGGGISGMAAAYRLSADHNVVLFEATSRLGGHARTVIAGKRGDQPVDTGFIVFNRVNYPHLCALFDALDVPIAPSDMSFGVSIDGGRIEYALRTMDTLFCQRRNLVRPAFMAMLRDVLRFNARAAEIVAGHEDMTIGGLLDRLGTGPWFRDYYILPFSGAIWSTPTRGILDFPAAAMVRFFQNHALMQTSGQHPWHTVRGGSIEYVRRLDAAMRARGAEIRISAPVAGIQRDAGGVQVRAQGAEWEHFDQVVLATHADDSLALLADPTEAERAALGAVRYQPNQAVLHADPAMMPRRRKAWASWAYTEAAGQQTERVSLTYWMNSLQPIPQDDPLFVTLNPVRPIDEALIYDSASFRHPVYDVAAVRAQAQVRALNGTLGTWYCGAWMKNGFHEDGMASAVEVAEAILAVRSETAAA